jgi:hypothetical protein
MQCKTKTFIQLSFCVSVKYFVWYRGQYYQLRTFSHETRRSIDSWITNYKLRHNPQIYMYIYCLCYKIIKRMITLGPGYLFLFLFLFLPPYLSVFFLHTCSFSFFNFLSLLFFHSSFLFLSMFLSFSLYNFPTINQTTPEFSPATSIFC